MMTITFSGLHWLRVDFTSLTVHYIELIASDFSGLPINVTLFKGKKQIYKFDPFHLFIFSAIYSKINPICINFIPPGSEYYLDDVIVGHCEQYTGRNEELNLTCDHVLADRVMFSVDSSHSTHIAVFDVKVRGSGE